MKFRLRLFEDFLSGGKELVMSNLKMFVIGKNERPRECEVEDCWIDCTDDAIWFYAQARLPGNLKITPPGLIVVSYLEHQIRAKSYEHPHPADAGITYSIDVQADMFEEIPLAGVEYARSN